MTEAEVRGALRQWVGKRNEGLAPGDLADDSPLIERRYLTSLQVADLLVFIEQLRQSPIDPAALKMGVFRSIDAIYKAFFAPAAAP